MAVFSATEAAMAWPVRENLLVVCYKIVINWVQTKCHSNPVIIIIS
jgi:hypothetical protein